MKIEYKKQQIIEAIITIARYIGKENPDLAERMYREIIKEERLPKSVEMIVYDMFVNDVNDRLLPQNGDVYISIQTIKTYAKVLHEHGSVDFQ